MRLSCAWSERSPACSGQVISVAGDPVDSDRKVRFAKFETVVCVFGRPDVDGEGDGSDENESDAEFGESVHDETPLSEIIVFRARD